MGAPFLLRPGDEETAFPDPRLAMEEPNGLLALGGCLSPRRLISAYAEGIFPWYSEGQPILWWSPDPRLVLFPDQLHISRSLRKSLRRGGFDVTLDEAFDDVLHACAAPRPKQDGTWLLPEMIQAYNSLHELGYAHSVEVRVKGELVGGLYGIALGGIFFGESMFSRVNNASKIAFVYLVAQLHRWNFRLIDCQVYSEHLASLGATEIPRDVFLKHLRQALCMAGRVGHWHLEDGIKSSF